MDPLAEGNPKVKNLGDSNQVGDTPLLKSTTDKAYQGEDLENDNCSGDTISLGSPKNEIIITKI